MANRRPFVVSTRERNRITMRGRLRLSLWLVAAMMTSTGCQQKDRNLSVVIDAARAYTGSIVTRTGRSHVNIEVCCQNATAEDVLLWYELRVEKIGRSGRATSIQAGPVSAAAGQAITLSQLSLELSGVDRCRIDLLLFRSEELVDRDLVVYMKESEPSAGHAEDEST